MAELQSPPDPDELLGWVERVAMFLAADGVPPIAGRILGWLMICDPPEQSAGQIGQAIGASRASLTTNMRVLLTMGFVSRRTRPGERTAYYRVEEGAWEQVVRRQIATLTAFRDITGDGIAMLGTNSGRTARIREAQKIFEWMAKVFDDAPPPPSGKGRRP
ncbi:GbsR/MarR family transcriptional regulator [Streptosporangium sp. NBC_01756]|uniref:GbsR/MarR family transcriptional regulator n=1 Tax=Streptosporangium sp. NBC_01756 TaxID=2975950 RepID=UPI002DD8336B|nr:transcriptional regulator [Streptosporangium sp. NBC_01756]WSC89603.1 transcriptional regulator [Streptosporangium sp. NBC_01756]